MIFHIHKIAYCPAHLAGEFHYLPDTESAIAATGTPWQPILIAGLAQLEVTEERENGLPKFTAKLTAKLCSERLPLGEASIYRLTTAAGHKLLLGLPRQPYPMTFQNVSVPKSAAEPSFVSLEVTLTADYPILSLYE